MSPVQVESYPAIIGGEKVNGSATFEVLDPSTGGPLAEVARCGEAEINQAVEAAREAHESVWRRTTPATAAFRDRRDQWSDPTRSGEGRAHGASQRHGGRAG